MLPNAGQFLLGSWPGPASGLGKGLAEVCEVLGPRDLCVENLEAPPCDMVLPLVERHGVSICLDVGHLAYEEGDACDFLTWYGGRVPEVHLGDVMICAVC